MAKFANSKRDIEPRWGVKFTPLDSHACSRLQVDWGDTEKISMAKG